MSQPPMKGAVFSGRSAANQSNPSEECNTGVERASYIFEGVNATNL